MADETEIALATEIINAETTKNLRLRELGRRARILCREFARLAAATTVDEALEAAIKNLVSLQTRRAQARVQAERDHLAAGETTIRAQQATLLSALPPEPQDI